jgi:hypothetical protein
MPRKINHLDLPDGWQKQILDLYENGASDTVIKKHIIKLRGKFSNHLWSAWLRDEKEFAETIETGRVLAQAWWEERGKDFDQRGFNSTLWYMNMKNRFGWADDKKDSTPIKVELKVDFVKPKE